MDNPGIRIDIINENKETNLGINTNIVDINKKADNLDINIDKTNVDREVDLGISTNITNPKIDRKCKREAARTKLDHVQGWLRATPGMLSVIG